jgi:hypothetical protein
MHIPSNSRGLKEFGIELFKSSTMAKKYGEEKIIIFSGSLLPLF